MLEVTSRIEGTPATSRPDALAGRLHGRRVLRHRPGPRPGHRRARPGPVVTLVPIMVTDTGIRDLAYTNLLPCGYSDRMLLSSLLTLPVPNGLAPSHAALTEPMAVGLHAVNVRLRPATAPSSSAAGRSALP